MAVADELAAAAELAHGKLDRVPVAVVRGYDYPRGDGTRDRLCCAIRRRTCFGSSAILTFAPRNDAPIV